MLTEPVGIVHSCFKEKFGIPRQPGLVTEARGQIELLPPWNREEAVRELLGFSHVWVIFAFHAVKADADIRLTVRPPRLGGNQRIGVFATRSPYRPNQLGLSVLKLDGIEVDNRGVVLQVSGLDILDQTPVFDIKPYVPYSDCLPEASSSIAAEAPATDSEVSFSTLAEQQCEQHQQRWPGLQALICAVLSQDPRPAYRRGADQRQYGMKLYDLNVRWEVEEEAIRVVQIDEVD